MEDDYCSSEAEEEVGDLKKSDSITANKATRPVSQTSQNLNIDQDESYLEDDFDKLGALDIDELDNIINFADNVATELAIQTTAKIHKMG